MKTTLTLIIGLTLAASAIDTYAQGGSQGRRGGAGGPPGGINALPPQIAAVFDLDKNNILSADEIAAAPELLKKLDKNNDGQIAADEFCPAGMNPPGRGAGRGGAGACRWLDTDGDGILSAQEIAAASESLGKLDRNGDSAVTPDEMRLNAGMGRGMGGGRRGAGGPPAR